METVAGNHAAIAYICITCMIARMMPFTLQELSYSRFKYEFYSVMDVMINSMLNG